jgi:hypothetical protein
MMRIKHHLNQLKKLAIYEGLPKWIIKILEIVHPNEVGETVRYQMVLCREKMELL